MSFRVKKYLKNFDKVEELLIEIEEKDKLRSFQPVMTGEIIMSIFGLHPSKEVGILKNDIREAILDCKIENTMEASYNHLIELGTELGFVALKKLEEI